MGEVLKFVTPKRSLKKNPKDNSILIPFLG